VEPRAVDARSVPTRCGGAPIEGDHVRLKFDAPEIVTELIEFFLRLAWCFEQRLEEQRAGRCESRVPWPAGTLLERTPSIFMNSAVSSRTNCSVPAL